MQRLEPRRPCGIVDVGTFGEEEHRSREAPRLAVDIGRRCGGGDLRRDGGQQQVGIGAREPRIERELHQEIGAVRDAMAPIS